MVLAYPIGFPLLLLCLLLPQRSRIRELQDEMDRQSSIAQRSMHLADLQGVQRDSFYEETKLIVKYKQGKVAERAFNRQRRLPALIVGGLMFVTGVLLQASPLIFSLQTIYRDIGFLILSLPGSAILLFALLPGDDWIIKKVTAFAVGIGILWSAGAVILVARIVRAYLNDEGGTCLDFRYERVPCWNSVVHIVLLVYIAIVTLEVLIRRPLMSLVKGNADLDALWRLWSAVGAAFSFNRFIMIVAYTFFAEGRAFLRSTWGMVVIICVPETVALLQLARSKLRHGYKHG